MDRIHQKHDDAPLLKISYHLTGGRDMGMLVTMTPYIEFRSVKLEKTRGQLRVNV